MPYNAPQSTPPAMSSSGNWMSLAQIIAGLVGSDSSTPPPTATQNAALAAGQGPLSASGANAWQSGLTNTLTNFGTGMPGSAPTAATPGYNPAQFGQPLGTQQSNSY